MPKKGYKQSEEHKKNLSLAWNYDKHFTEKTRDNISKAKKGSNHTEESKMKMRKPKSHSHSPWNKNLTKETDARVLKYVNKRLENGFRQSEETKKKMSISKKGKDAWNKDLKGEEYLKHFKGNSTWLMRNNSEDMKNKSSQTRKKLFSEGKISIWNKGLYGERNSGWMNGISFEPYPPTFNNGFKDLIRLRDNFCCLKCGISEQKHMLISRRILTIHHIDYNKKNTCLQNCCALCLSCNSKANKNRPSWTEFFQSLLSEKYGYIYLKGGPNDEKEKNVDPENRCQKA